MPRPLDASSIENIQCSQNCLGRRDEQKWLHIVLLLMSNHYFCSDYYKQLMKCLIRFLAVLI